MESHRRTLAKAISWRVLATLVTATVATAVTGEPRIGAEVGLADALVKIVVYYVHERMWLRIGLGRARTG